MDHPDIEVIEKQTVCKGFLQIDRYRLRHRKFDGSWSDVVVREVCERGHAVAVLLYDPSRDSLVMIEQFRVGAAAGGGPAWLTEIVAGIIEEGEAPDEVARREVREEAGCEVTALETICDYFPSPGAFSEKVTLFCGRVDSAAVGTTGGCPDEHEDIRITVIAYDEAMRLMDENRLNNSVTIIALAWLARHKEALRARWA